MIRKGGWREGFPHEAEFQSVQSPTVSMAIETDTPNLYLLNININASQNQE